MYHRKNAIYPATVVGRPKQEDYFIGDFLQELLSPLFPLVMKGVKELKPLVKLVFTVWPQPEWRTDTRERPLPVVFAFLAKGSSL